MFFGVRLVSVLTILTIFIAQVSFAQVTISGLATDTRIKACDDFASSVLHDPWDMNNHEDIPYFGIADYDIAYASNISMSNGSFSFTTTTANGSAFALWSPDVCGIISPYETGRWGSQLNVDSTKASKYRTLTWRGTLAHDDDVGYRVKFNRSCDASQTYTLTTAQATQHGTRSYTVDLGSVGIETGSSSSTAPWTNGSITGLAILPVAENGKSVSIDHVLLQDPTSCGGTAVAYSAATSGSNDLFNLYVDDDTSLSNGYYQKLVNAQPASISTSASLTTLGLFPGNYKVTGILHSDYGVLVRDDQWDMEEASDLFITAGLTSEAFSGGSYTATTTAEDQQIYLNIPSVGIDASRFKRLSFKLSRTGVGANEPVTIGWGTGAKILYPMTHGVGGDVFQYDLSLEGTWTGTINTFYIRPAFTSGAGISLDFISIRSSGYVTDDESASAINAQVASSTGSLLVNNPPLVNILQPDYQGGEAVKAWNGESGEIQIFRNQTDAVDPSFTNENLTAFLPDVRSKDGVRGTLFKSTNDLGNGDPYWYYTFPISSNPYTIDPSVYKIACVRMLLDKSLDLCLGSIPRFRWSQNGGTQTVGKGISAVYDQWSGSKWGTYCLDLTNYELEIPSDPNWSSSIKDGFGLDPHEFEKDTCTGGVPTGTEISVTTYLDWLKLRSHDKSKSGKFNITFSHSDSDDTSQVSLYYNTSNSTSGGTLITTLAEGTSHYTWDTSALSNGTYYIYAVADDGLNTTSSIGNGPLLIQNDGSGLGNPPVLSVESPAAGNVVCDSMQVKGYSLEPDRFEDVALIEVLADGTLISSFEPSLYNPNARSSYPTKDYDNAGFNRAIDVSGLSTGSHTIIVRAISTDGDVSEVSVSVSKSATGCTSFISDPDPSGSPVNPEVDTGDELGAMTKPSLSAKVKKGTLTVKVTNSLQSDASNCRITPYVGVGNGQLTTAGTARTPVKDALILTAKKVKFQKLIKNKKTKYKIKVVKSCDGRTSVESATKSFGGTETKGTNSASKFVKLINKAKQT